MKSILFVILWLPSLLFGQQTLKNPSLKEMRDSIVSQVNKGVIPSFSVGVSQGGEIIWLESFGYSDKENSTKATVTTTYPLGSLSKSITGTVLMIMAERKLVNLLDPVNKYLGAEKLTKAHQSFGEPTLSQLANMMAGIPHQLQYIYDDEKKGALTIEEQIKRYGLVAFPPGQAFNYSNFSPSIIEKVVANVTNKSFTAFMHDDFFTPLKMANSYVYKSELPANQLAKGYDRRGRLLPPSEFYPKGGAGFYGSITDLMNYGMFHLKNNNKNNRLLTDQSIDFLHMQTEPSFSSIYSYGWGILNMENGNQTLLSNGAIDGASSSLLLLPSRDIAVACLTNATVGNDFTDQMAFKIANSLVKGYLEKLTGFVQANEPKFADKPFRTVDTLMGVWEGKIKTYNDSTLVKITFEKDGKILVKVGSQFETLLNSVTTNNGLITGKSFGALTLPETTGIPHYLNFVLKPTRTTMVGSVSAQSYQTNRPYFLIPASIILNRKP